MARPKVFISGNRGSTALPAGNQHVVDIAVGQEKNSFADKHLTGMSRRSTISIRTCAVSSHTDRFPFSRAVSAKDQSTHIWAAKSSRANRRAGRPSAEYDRPRCARTETARSKATSTPWNFPLLNRLASEHLRTAALVGQFFNPACGDTADTGKAQRNELSACPAVPPKDSERSRGRLAISYASRSMRHR